jgi:hypothetical protein
MDGYDGCRNSSWTAEGKKDVRVEYVIQSTQMEH